MIWAVVRTVSWREVPVARELERGLGIEGYVPIEVVGRTRKGEDSVSPLMPGYVFAGARYGFPWRDIRELRGVIGWLTTHGNTPAYVQQFEIDRIRAMEREHNRARDVRPPSIGVGARVRVKNGSPFETIESLIRAVRGSNATIEVPMLGSTRSVQVPLSQLEEVA